MEFLANLHPKIVHFPLAFLMIYPISELLAFITKKQFVINSANLFLLIGTIGAFLAVFSGNQAFSQIKNWSKEGLDLFDHHQLFANYTMWFFTGVLALRIYLTIKKKINSKTIFVLFILSLVGCYFVYQTGNYGGKLAEERIKQTILRSTSSD